MLLMLPSGTGELSDMPDREAFADGDEGMAAWADGVEAATEGFAAGHRAESTFREHEAPARPQSRKKIITFRGLHPEPFTSILHLHTSTSPHLHMCGRARTDRCGRGPLRG